MLPVLGDPATNKLEPLSTPTVAAEIAIPPTVVNVGDAGLLKFTFTTLAVVPPHSGPQFRMKAVLSVLSVGSKTAEKGWSRWPVGSTTTFAVLVPVSITKKPPALEPGRALGLS